MTTCVIPGCVARQTGTRLSLHLFPDPSREPEVIKFLVNIYVSNLISYIFSAIYDGFEQSMLKKFI